MNERDLELLSAYLDNALTADERSAVDARLLTDAALRRELDTLRETKLLIGGLPQLKAPRDFTLTAAMVGARPRTLPVILSPWVSALSAAAAVVITVLGLITLNVRPPALTSVASAPTETMIVQPQMAAPAALPTMGMATAAMESAPDAGAAGAAIAIMPAPTMTEEAARTGNAMDAADASTPTQAMTTQAEAMQMAAPTATAMSTQPPTATSTDAIIGVPATASPTVIPLTETLTPVPTATPVAPTDALPPEGFGGAALFLLASILFVFALATTFLRGRR
jgi:anti-sigma factor RsiW